jgi:hypothetical protein
MNRWKVISGILLIFMLGAFCGVVGSGLFIKHRIKRFMDPAGPPPPIRFLQQQLDAFELSVDQQARIDRLFDDMHRDFVELFRQSQPEFKQTFDRYVLQIRNVLRADQQEKLDRVAARIESRLHRMQPPPFREKGPLSGDRPMGPGPERMLDRLAWELDLSRDQVRQMRPILEEQMEKRRSLLLEDTAGDERSGLRERTEKLHQETNRQLEAILTPEQVESFRKIGRNRRP